MKPEFVDNRDGNTLLAALRAHMGWAREAYKRPLSLCVATGYFNPEGFSMLAGELEHLSGVKLLLGAEPQYPPAREVPLPGQPRGEARQVVAALAAAEAGIRGDRNLLEFTREANRSVERLLAFLASGKLEVRRYARGFLHGKAFVFSDQDGVIAGSSNLTAAGLVGNLELNLGHYAPSLVGRVQAWFDSLWAEAEPYDLAALYQERVAEYDPYLVYLRVLWERYGAELSGERDAAGHIRLTTFQTDGVARAEKILAQYHGVVVADGVGLGKTFIAGELIRRVKERRQRVLVVAPAALRDGTWRTFFDDFDLKADCVSFEEIALKGGKVSRYWDEYSLIVVDEAHAFRNPDTERAAALRTLLAGSPPRDLVLLTATPVNNSLWDLYYLLCYFAGHDAFLADRGIPSLKRRFEHAAALDPEDLRPETLFDVLDTVTVRRTRHFVKRYYPSDRIRGPGGVEMPVRFPTPEVRAVVYRLEGVLPGFFADFAAAVMPEHGEPELTLARFRPSSFRRGGGSGVEASEVALTGLVRSALLKRFESSVHAFVRTLERMVESHDLFVKALDSGYVPTADAIAAVGEAQDVASEDALVDLLREHGAEPARGYDVPRLRAAVLADRALLERYRGRAAKVTAATDPKLAALRECVVDLARRAAHDGQSDDERRDNRKVLVFSYFAETVDWIVAYLRDAVASDADLEVYRGRMASVSGQKSRDGVTREDAVFGFAPRSTQAPPERAADLFDILVCTDVLAEGMNLQQCRNIVNFDLPWNPMRLVQRHGRVDRIGSPHARVHLRCFFPDEGLDKLLDLETRIRRKLAQAAASIGVESEVIPGGATGEVVFAETREEIERLRQEDPTLFETGGEEAGAHSGEEYRQELRRGLEHYGEARIRDLPWTIGSGFAGGPVPGHLFCARVGERSFLRFVPAGGGPIVRETLECLRRIACTEATPRDLPQSAAEAAYPAWQAARADIYAEWSFATDPANLQPAIRPAFKRAADHLRANPPAGATQEDLDRATASLLAPRGYRVERLIHEAIRGADARPQEASESLWKAIRDLGLQPYEPPKPLPAIRESDVLLVCWMAVAAGG